MEQIKYSGTNRILELNTMENKVLSTISIDELKKKINRFYFLIGGFFGGHDSIEINIDDTPIKYIFCNSIKGNNDEYILSKEKWNDFLEKIFNENVLNWKNKYHDNNILDGTEWKLEMEFKDLPKFESYGSNEYPSNWKNIFTIINDYFPQMELNLYYDINEEDDDEKENR
jgi:hypothetical protein